MKIAIFILIVVIVGAIVMFNLDKSKDKKRCKNLQKEFEAIPDFNASLYVTGIKYMYKFAVDNVHRKVLYLTDESKRIIPYDKIVGVEIKENDILIYSKLSDRPCDNAAETETKKDNAAILPQEHPHKNGGEKKVSYIDVNIKLKSSCSQPLVLRCFDSRTMTAGHKAGINVRGIDGYIYQIGMRHAHKIACIVGVIIDAIDKETAQSIVDSTDIKIFDKMKELMGEVPQEVQDAIDSDNKLLAIKLYRELKGVSLIEAKAFVESHL
jgi:hypothetical protein